MALKPLIHRSPRPLRVVNVQAEDWGLPIPVADKVRLVDAAVARIQDDEDGEAFVNGGDYGFTLKAAVALARAAYERSIGWRPSRTDAEVLEALFASGEVSALAAFGEGLAAVRMEQALEAIGGVSLRPQVETRRMSR